MSNDIIYITELRIKLRINLLELHWDKFRVCVRLNSYFSPLLYRLDLLGCTYKKSVSDIAFVGLYGACTFPRTQLTSLGLHFIH